MHIRSGLVLLLIATTTSLAVADECDFTTSPLRTNWAGLPRAAMSCMQAIPLRASENTNTIAVVRKVFEGYAFSDLVTANVAPYRLNVRLPFFALSSTVLLVTTHQMVAIMIFQPITHMAALDEFI